jgi:hypothetical protein
LLSQYFLAAVGNDPIAGGGQTNIFIKFSAMSARTMAMAASDLDQSFSAEMIEASLG